MGEVPELIFHVVEFDSRDCCMLGLLVLHPCMASRWIGFLKRGGTSVGARVNSVRGVDNEMK